MRQLPAPWSAERTEGGYCVSSSVLISVSLISCSSLSCSVIFSNCCCAALICSLIRLARICRSPRMSPHEEPSNCSRSHTAAVIGNSVIGRMLVTCTIDWTA